MVQFSDYRDRVQKQLYKNSYKIIDTVIFKLKVLRFQERVCIFIENNNNYYCSTEY